jgi:hypothetical protein
VVYRLPENKKYIKRNEISYRGRGKITITIERNKEKGTIRKER